MRREKSIAFLTLGILLSFALIYVVPLAIAGSSDTYNVTAGITGSNNPVIDSVGSISAQDVTPGSTTTVSFTFTVSDNDGYHNLNNSTATAVFNRTGETSRSNTSCASTNVDWNTNNYTCSVGMQFYDATGTWSVNVSIRDDDSNFVQNTTTTFTYNSGLHMNMTPDSISFGTTLNAGQTNVSATDDPIVVQNIGNYNITQVNITAYDLVGVTYPSYTIGASNFEVSATDTADSGSALSNAIAVTASGVTSVRGASSTDSLYFFLDVPSTNIQVQTYNTVGGTDWTLGVYGTSS